MESVWRPSIGRQTPPSYREADPYPAQADAFNEYFVRTTWGAEAAAAYQPLSAFNNLAEPDALTHINYAYELLHGGRPDQIEIVPGGQQLDWVLADMLIADPELNIVVKSNGD